MYDYAILRWNKNIPWLRGAALLGLGGWHAVRYGFDAFDTLGY